MPNNFFFQRRKVNIFEVAKNWLLWLQLQYYLMYDGMAVWKINYLATCLNYYVCVYLGKVIDFRLGVFWSERTSLVMSPNREFAKSTQSK